MPETDPNSHELRESRETKLFYGVPCRIRGSGVNVETWIREFRDGGAQMDVRETLSRQPFDFVSFAEFAACLCFWVP